MKQGGPGGELYPYNGTPVCSNPLETQVYQAILERRPAPMIARLQELLGKPDPALGFLNGELRFWLGWAQEVAGEHSAAQETWRAQLIGIFPQRTAGRPSPG